MRRTRGIAAFLLLATTLLAGAAPVQSASRQLLMVSYSAGFQHDVVRRPIAGTRSTAETVVAELGRRAPGFDVTFVATRAELEALSVTSVRAHDAILFFTSGELPMAPAVRQAMFEMIGDGGGFVGVHSAADTWYSIPEYHDLLGGRFDGHPWHQRVRLIVEDLSHPATRHLGDAFEIADEIYQFRDWRRRDLRVLLRLDPRSVDIGRGKRADGDYALAWTRSYGRGRVVYTALGHEAAVWADERFKTHLRGAIAWALGHR